MIPRCVTQHPGVGLRLPKCPSVFVHERCRLPVAIGTAQAFRVILRDVVLVALRLPMLDHAIDAGYLSFPLAFSKRQQLEPIWPSSVMVTQPNAIHMTRLVFSMCRCVKYSLSEPYRHRPYNIATVLAARLGAADYPSASSGVFNPPANFTCISG